VGFAIVNTMASSAIAETQAFWTTPGPGLEAAMTMSAPFMASGTPPVRSSPFVRFARSHFSGYAPLSSVRPGCRMPLLSVKMMFFGLAPAAIRMYAVRTFEAPAPTMATVTSAMRFPTTFTALIAPATTIVAVPCWSSCHTGISSVARSRARMSKHFGCAMSSRFTPPNAGVMRCTVSTISSGSFVFRQIGKASTPPRNLNSSDLPSMTGSPASGPMSPRPRTRVPSVTIATLFHLFVISYTASGCFAISRHGAATPGVYQIAKSSKERTGVFRLTSILPW